VSIDHDVHQALEICKGDAMAALRMVLVANSYNEQEIARLKQEASRRLLARKGSKTAAEKGQLTRVN
jgi:hypothetical protein